MSFCPECKSEYRPGFNRCSDCDVDLVEQLPEETEIYDMVEAGTVDDPVAGNMVREAMANEDIPCSLTGRGSEEGMMPGVASPTREVKVMVAREYLPRAKEILKAFFEQDCCSGEAEFLMCSNCECPIDDEDKICPACGEPLEGESSDS